MRIALLAVAAAMLVGCGKKPADGDGGGTVPTQFATRGSPSPTGAEDAITYSNIYVAYEKNPIAADSQFKGKRLTVKDVKVEFISRSRDDRPYIAPMSAIMRTGLAEPWYYFYLASDAEATKVKKDASYVISGLCDGYRKDSVWRGADNASWRVEFSDCRVLGEVAAKGSP